MSEEAVKAAEWSCELQDINGGQKIENWTVGKKYRLNCEGEPLAEVLSAQAKFKFEKEDFNYSLKILEVVKSDHSNAQLVVTSYKPGKYSGVALKVTDGKSEFAVKDFNWTVESILPPGQQNLPYASIGPFQLSRPLWYWAVIILLTAVVVGFLAKKIKKHLDRKSLREELALHGTALSPFNQYVKDLRNIRRKYFGHLKNKSEEEELKEIEECLTKVDQTFRMYLLREFLVPADEWSTSEVINEIRSRHRKVFNDYGFDIKKVLKELDRAKKVKQVTFMDCEQLSYMGQNLSEKIMKTKRFSK